MKCFQLGLFGYRKKCIKDKCAKWVELYSPTNEKDKKPNKTGNCSEYWKIITKTEQVESINRLARVLFDNKNEKK